MTNAKMCAAAGGQAGQFASMQTGARAATWELSRADGCVLSVETVVPDRAAGLVVFVDGLCGDISAPEEAFLKRRLHDGRVGTAVIRPIVPARGFDPDRVSRERRKSVIDAGVDCLIGVSGSIAGRGVTGGLGLGYLASDGGSAVALIAAADLGDEVRAVVSVCGRPDLAGDALAWVNSPTLLIVAGDDRGVLAHNELACDLLEGEKELEVIEGVSHYGDTAPALVRVAELAGAWFREHL